MAKKTYESWEVVKMLTENPKLEFKGACIINGKTIEITAYVDEKDIVLSNGISANFGFSTNDEWELVQQPVPFMEAVKAYAEGKTIRCEYKGMTTIFNDITGIGFNNNHRRLFNRNDDHITKTVLVGEILEGQWYVEGD